jgi:hypothetical protein
MSVDLLRRVASDDGANSVSQMRRIQVYKCCDQLAVFVKLPEYLECSVVRLLSLLSTFDVPDYNCPFSQLLIEYSIYPLKLERLLAVVRKRMPVGTRYRPLSRNRCRRSIHGVHRDTLEHVRSFRVRAMAQELWTSQWKRPRTCFIIIPASS